MVLNRKTDRRRRLLVDSNSLVGEVGETGTKSKKQSAKINPPQADVRKAYAVGAKRRHQRKVTDLIPKRRLAYSFTIVALVGLLVGVNLLAYFAPSWHSIIGRQGMKALAVTGPSSLATYLSTIFFATAAVLCLQIYALRQHRCDDYEGTYRVWGWLAPAFAIASLGSAMPLTVISQNIFTAVSGRGFSVTWLPMAIGVGFASLFLIRYLMEVRGSFGTVAWAGLAWFAICTSWAGPEILKAVSADVDQSLINDLALGNGLLVAAGASLLANLTYARFVFLRSNGFIEAKPKQIKSKATLPFRPFRERTDARRTRADRKAAAAAEKDAASTDEQSVAKQTRKSTRKASANASKVKNSKASKPAKPAPKAVPKPVPKAAPTPQPVATSKPVASSVEAPVAADQAETPAKQVSLSASERLKQMAAATRVQKAPDQHDDQATSATIRMSKAQRRKLRKQEKKRNRAA